MIAAALRSLALLTAALAVLVAPPAFAAPTRPAGGPSRARFEAADFGFSFRIRPPHARTQLGWHGGFVLGASFQPSVGIGIR